MSQLGSCEQGHGKKAKLTEGEEDRGDNGTLSTAEQVFGNHLIRENIIKHLLNPSDDGSYPSEDEIGSYRLVQKSWLREVTRLSFASQIPVFCLNLNKTNSLNNCAYVRKNGQKKLDHFVSTMTNSVDDGTTPPFSLKITKDFFQHENHQSLSQFLGDKCTNGLLSVDMGVPKNGGSLPFIFPEPILLPNLKSIGIFFRQQKNITHKKGASANARNYGSNSNFVPFIQSILNGSAKLKEFILSCEQAWLHPSGITDLIFPNTLEKLFLECALNSMQLEQLALKSLPNLTYLSFQITDDPLPNDVLYRILNNVKNTLRHFEVADDLAPYSHIPQAVSTLRFPVMKCLETLQVFTVYVELETQAGLPLQTLLPVLRKVEMYVQIVPRFQKWTENSCFPNVTSFECDWWDGESPHHVVFNVEQMKAVHGTFPNLKEFSFIGHDIAREALEYLFVEMRQLTRLKIQLGACNATTSDHWDSLLIGVSIEALSQLRDNPALWKNTEFMTRLCMGLPSIKNLAFLETLELDASRLGSALSWDQTLVSDLVFAHAITKMPNLKKVCMEGAFKVLRPKRGKKRLRSSIF